MTDAIEQAEAAMDGYGSDQNPFEPPTITQARNVYQALGVLLVEHKRVLAVQGSDRSTQSSVDRVRVSSVIHSMLPEEFNGKPIDHYQLCEDDSCLWYDIADVLLGVFTITERTDR